MVCSSRVLSEVLAACLGDDWRHGSLGLWAVCVYGTDGKCVTLLVTTVSFRRKFDNGVQRDLDVRQIGLREVVEVRVTFVDRVDSGSAFRVYTGKPR